MEDPKATHNPVVFAVDFPLFVLMVLVFSARIYSRLYPCLRLWWDDLFLTLAFLSETVTFAIATIILIITGGHHIMFIPLPVISRATHLGIALFILAPVSNALIKISLCLMLLRLKGHDSWWRMFLWGMICVTSVVLVGSMISTLLSCRPLSAFWNLDERLSGDCWTGPTFMYISYGFGVYFAFTDFVMAMLPLTFILNLQLPFREKVTLTCLMCAGLFSMAAGIAKIVLTKQLDGGIDYFYGMPIYGLAMHLELFVGIIAACVPTLKGPFERLMNHFGIKLSTIDSRPRSKPYFVTGKQIMPTRILSGGNGRIGKDVWEMSLSEDLVEA